MKENRRVTLRQRLAALLLACLVLPYVPALFYTAEAAEETNLITPENDRGDIQNGKYILSHYEFHNNTLELTNTYHYESGPLLTYYTVDTVWSRNSTREDGRKPGYPELSGTKGVDWVRTGVRAEDKKPGTNTTTSVYTYSQSKLKSILSQLFGTLQPDTEYTVYMSEIFVLKQRYADGSSTLYSTQYNNLDDIRAAADWSDTTWEQFEAYYDVPLTFRLAGGTVEVVCVDMDNGYSVIEGAGYEEQLLYGEGVTIVPEATLTEGGETLTYAGVYNISCNIRNCTLENTGGPGRVTMTDADTIYVYLGYQRAETPVVTPKPTDAPAATPTPKPTATPKPGISYDRIDRFYATEEGYTLDEIANQVQPGYSDYKVAVNKGSSTSLKESEVTKRELKYLIGTDDSGNRWYFKRKGTEAYEVHPYIYEGKKVNTREGIQEITKLVFPATLRMSANGTPYTVISIGGGGATYHEEESSASENSFTGYSLETDFDSYKGFWSCYNPYYSENTTTGACNYRYHEEYASYWYGVVGNGSIESAYIYETTSYNMYNAAPSVITGTNRYYNYYVYNTTLKSITIPDTVTEILDYAFCYCQKLEEINGGANVAKIGDYAFMGVPTVAAAVEKSGMVNAELVSELERMMKAKISTSEKINGKTWKSLYYYNEAMSDTELTGKMLKWQSQIVLGNQWSFPEPSQIPKLTTLGKRAFAFHTNLADVVLSEQVSEIGTECFGYDKLEEITVKNDTAKLGKHYQTLGTQGMLTAAADPRTIVHAENTSTSAAYVEEYSSWYRMNGKREIELDGRGATKQGQTTVIMAMGEMGPDVIPPEKTGYTFRGYFTGVRGSGRQYYDENGKGTRVWLEYDIGILYAYWEQKPVEQPEQPEEPEPQPEEQVSFEILPNQTSAELFSEEYCVTEGIPSVETVNLHATGGAFLLSCLLEKKSGMTMVRAHMEVSYRTQYEEPESEALVISKPQKMVVEVMVPKVWSYWKIKEGGVYFPEKLSVQNNCLEKGAEEILLGSGKSNKKPSYCLTAYEEEERFFWHSYDTDGTPSLFLSPVEEQYIISEIPGELPDAEQYLRKICRNAAIQETTQFSVRSDGLSVEGITVLSDEIETEGHGAAPQRQSVEQLKQLLQGSGTVQAEKKGIALLATAKNGAYETVAEIVYQAEDALTGNRIRKRVPIENTNAIFIHTPVVCFAELTAEHETEYQCKRLPEKSCVLVLDEEGIRSEYVIQISNYGYHSEKKGYGQGSYTKYLAKKDGKPQNEVRFPVAVWVDVGNDRNTENDVLLQEETWYTVGTRAQRFYLPVWIPEGSYSFECRSIAVNAVEGQEQTEKIRNLHWEKDGAVTEETVFIVGRLSDFTVYEISGADEWEEVQTEVWYTVGLTEKERAEGRSEYETLPLRTGVHPQYRNLGRLSPGSSFSFRLKSVGSFFAEKARLTIVPELVRLRENEYDRVDVYYERETETGAFLTKWSGEEVKITLASEAASKADVEWLAAFKKTEAGKKSVHWYGEEIGEAVRNWYGSFSLPAQLYIAEPGAEVLEYQKRYGLDFTEPFWLQKEVLLLCFSIRLESAKGEILYYGRLPEEALNNIWCAEAGTQFRVDANGILYPVCGGEIAVLASEKGSPDDFVIYGIY